MKEPRAEVWKQYEYLEGLYRFYMDKIVTFHSFYLPIAGGIAVFALSRQDALSSFALLIPLTISIGAAHILSSARKESKELRDAIRNKADQLDILASHTEILVRSVYAFFALHILISIYVVVSIIILYISGSIFPTRFCVDLNQADHLSAPSKPD